jgi:acetate kinase
VGRAVVLVVNAGSRSLKRSLVAGDEATAVDAYDVDCDAVAHRVVHGGGRFDDAVVVDDAVVGALEGVRELAPLHNGRALEAIGEARRALPDVPHVAVFDTAFHATLPEEASTYAIPRAWRERHGIRRYGFHGLSVAWAAERVPVERLVVCHLGGGCSVTAVREGRSVDTTMGFTPLEGVPMATRAGSVDPGALLYLLRHGLSVEELEDALEHASGILALGGSADLREADGPLALAVFSYRVAGAVAAMATALDGLDALVFTAGVGEGSTAVRAAVCGRLGFLGVELDAEANEAAAPDAEVAAPGAAVRVVVLRSREELVAARTARRLLGLDS